MTVNPSYTKCPKCEAIYSFTDTASENTEYTELWSDGYFMTPTRKDIIEFAKCLACKTFFWIQENSIPELGDILRLKKMDNTWLLDNISIKEINLIKEAFRSGLASDPEKEIFLRINLWHNINHIIRKYDSQGLFKTLKQKFFETAQYKDSLKQYNALSSLKLNNLIRLANLLKLDENENTNYLLFAEIYRELGDFSKAMIFCYKAETMSLIEPNRISKLKQHITSKSKATYKL